MGYPIPSASLTRVVDVGGHARARNLKFQLLANFDEQSAVFGQIDGLQRGAEQFLPTFDQLACQIDRRLSAQLSDKTHRLDVAQNLKHVFKGQRFKEQARPKCHSRCSPSRDSN